MTLNMNVTTTTDNVIDNEMESTELPHFQSFSMLIQCMNLGGSCAADSFFWELLESACGYRDC